MPQLTSILHAMSILDEPTERSQPSAWTNHDHRHRWLEWQTELRFAYINRHSRLKSICGHFKFEPVGGDSILHSSGTCLVLDNDSGDVDGGGVLFWRGRDGVITRLEAREDLTEVVHGDHDRGQVL